MRRLFVRIVAGLMKLRGEGALLLSEAPGNCRADLRMSILSSDVMWWLVVPLDGERYFQFDAGPQLATEYLAAINAAHNPDQARADHFLSNPQEPTREGRFRATRAVWRDRWHPRSALRKAKDRVKPGLPPQARSITLEPRNLGTLELWNSGTVKLWNSEALKL
jgi:hypothetical protein